MHRLDQFQKKTISIVFTDIDGTLTKNGRLPSNSYEALWKLHSAGFEVVPVTGRPAGWCELIARLWPVHGVIGENGAFYFRLAQNKMKRTFARSRAHRLKDRQRLKEISQVVQKEVPGCKIASDQFSRLFDLAVDFAEDVSPLTSAQIQKIVEVFKSHGATAKVSNIHVNGWYGNHDKLKTCLHYLKREFNLDPNAAQSQCIFVGDSPNDEPMFAHFQNSFAVANIKEFLNQITNKPSYCTDLAEADGFCEVADRLLALKAR